jgi:hypothetical protein
MRAVSHDVTSSDWGSKRRKISSSLVATATVGITSDCAWRLFVRLTMSLMPAPFVSASEIRWLHDA